VPARRSGTGPRARHANLLLLLPWPLRVRESDFRSLEGSVQSLAKEPFGFFEFAPSERLDLDLLSRTIIAARDEVDSVDVVILPESAVDERDVDNLEALLDSHGVISLITGVRQSSPQPGRHPGNWVHIGVSPRLEKGGPLPKAPGEQWFHIRQNKHHRWALDEGRHSMPYTSHVPKNGPSNKDLKDWFAECCDQPSNSSAYDTRTPFQEPHKS
jgi:hypothetical protein